MVDGKIALEEHFALAETIDASYAKADLTPELRLQILEIGSGRIAEMDRGGVELSILSLGAPGIQTIPGIIDLYSPFPLTQETNRRGSRLAIVGRL